MTNETNGLFQSFFAICLLLAPVLGGFERRCTPYTPIRGRYCGEVLNQVLHMTCRFYGGYYGGSAKKRSDPGFKAHGQVKQTQDKTSPLDQSLDTPTFLQDRDSHIKNLITKQLAHHFLDKRHNDGQGISCECCNHRCSMRELREYCSDARGDSDSYLDLV